MDTITDRTMEPISEVQYIQVNTEELSCPPIASVKYQIMICYGVLYLCNICHMAISPNCSTNLCPLSRSGCKHCTMVKVPLENCLLHQFPHVKRQLEHWNAKLELNILNVLWTRAGQEITMSKRGWFYVKAQSH